MSTLSIPQDNMNPVIKIKNLSVTYFLDKPNEVQALRDINLEIYQGEFIIFFGPSGCGKSTLLYTIAGLETDITGNIYVDNKNIAEFNHKELGQYHQKKTGMVFQAFYLINSLSVLKNVILPQIAIRKRKKEREKRAIELLEHFGVKEQIYKLPNELSGGQQQRVAICRALVNNPDILFADEPVGNLDSKSSDDVMKLFKDLNEKQKKTVILVTHDPAHLSIAHRVFYMKDGAVIKVKINKAINQAIASSEEEKIKPSLSRELELLARTFSNISGSMGGLLIPFKAKQITAEALTGMTNDEISRIENKVKESLTLGIQDNDTMFRYLDEEIEKGGLGMDKRTAKKLSEKIIDIVKEIKILEQEESSSVVLSGNEEYKETIQIRHYLFNAFNIQIKEFSTVEIIDKMIKKRLKNKIDRKTFQKKLDLSIKEGGAGLDKRTAKKIAKRLELLILGKYR